MIAELSCIESSSSKDIFAPVPTGRIAELIEEHHEKRRLVRQVADIARACAVLFARGITRENLEDA